MQKIIGYTLLLLITCLTLGCKNNFKKNNSNCNLSPETRNKLITAKATDSSSIYTLTKLITPINEYCKQQQEIGDSAMMNVFFSWLSNPEQNSFAPEFFIQASHNKKLSNHYQIEAALYLSIVYIAEYKLEKSDSIIAMLNPDLNNFDTKNKILFYRNQGLLFNLKNNLEEATVTFQKAIDLVLKSDKVNNCELGNIYGNYGNVYMKLADYNKAVEIIKKSCNLIEECNPNSNDLGAATSNLGVAYNYVHKVDSALYCFRKVIAYNDTHKEGDWNNELAAYTNIIGIYLKQNNYDSAQYYTRKAYHITNKVADSSRLMLLYLSNTICNAVNSDVSNNILKIKDFLPVLYKNNDLYNIQICYQSLSNIYQLNGNYKEAIIYENKVDSIKEISISADYRLRVNDLENKYNIAKKNAEIQEKVATLKYNRLQIYILTALLIIILMGFLLKIQNIRKKEKGKMAELADLFANKLIRQIEEERSKIAMEIHDDINHELMLLKNNNEDSNSMLSDKIEYIINKARQISRNIYPVTLPYIGLVSSISNLSTVVMNTYDKMITTEISYQKEISLDFQLHIYRIIQEALNNIVKHSNASAAFIKLTENEKKNQLELIIKDNGKGFNVNNIINNTDSFGLHSILQRANLIGGKTNIESSDNGTTITILIPI